MRVPVRLFVTRLTRFIASSRAVPLLAAVALLLPLRGAAAQTDCDLDPYYPGCYWEVMVRPDGGPDTLASSSSGSFTFWVVNTGTNFDTYDFSCSGTGSITCTGVGSEVSLLGGDSIQVGVTYTSSGGGQGSVSLSATGRAVGTSDGGSSVLLIDAGMTLNAEVHNGYHHSAALCALTCFNVTVAYTTPAYISMDVPRAATLLYTSDAAQAQYLVQVNVRDFKNESGAYASKISIRLKRPNNSLVKLTNGEDSVFFNSSQGNGPVKRLGVQFDDTTLATGAYDYTVVVRANWASAVKELTASVRVLVLNETQSPYGAGWTVAGANRLALVGTTGLVTWDGAGTIQYFTKQPCDATGCTFTPPLGDFDTLRFDSVAARADVNDAYTRTTVDRTKLVFDDQGRLRFVADPFNNKVRYYWSTGPKVDSIVDPAGKRIEFTYTSGKLASIRDVPGNRTSTFTINGSNNLTRVQDPAGGSPLDSLTYDSSHRLLSRRDRRGGRWSYAYDYTGRLASDSTPAVTAEGTSQRLMTAYVSTLAGMVGTGTSGSPSSSKDAAVADRATITPPVGSQRKVSLDAFGAIRQVLEPPAEFASYSRNSHSQVTAAIDSTGNKTFTWSGPRLTSENDIVRGATVTYEWNATTNRMTRRHGTRIADTRYYYNSAGIRLDSTKTNSKPATLYTYDSYGRVLTVTDSKGHVTNTYYSSSGLKNTDSVKVGSRRRSFVHDSLGRTFVVKHPGGRMDSTFYDALNRVQRTGGLLGVKTTYTYGDSLFITMVTDANGNQYKAEKNALGWDTSTVDPKGARNWYRHNKAGQVRYWINRRGDTTQFVYDSIGRLLGRGPQGGQLTEYEYGPNRVASGNNEGSDTVRVSGDTTYEIAVRGGNTFIVRTRYDTLSRDVLVLVWRAGESQPTQQVRYDLDSIGRLRSIAPFSTSYTDTLLYSTDDLVTGMRWHGTWSVDNHFRPGHNVARDKYLPDGYHTNYGHEFVYDTAGHIVEQVKGFGWKYERYTYDVIGRLRAFKRYAASPTCAATDTTSEYGSPCAYTTTLLASDTFHYDPVGNRLDGSAQVDSANRLLAMDGYTMNYDLDGNLTRKRLADTMVFNQRLYWNRANVLDSVRTTVNSVTTTVKFGYDARGRRVRKTVGSDTTYYVYSGRHVQAEYSSSGALRRRYAYLPGTDHPHAVFDGSNWRYYLSDGRGNVQLVFNPGLTPQISALYQYTPFGTTDSTVGSERLRFGSREYDAETRLYYNRARYYDPEVGRFISEDPLGLAGGPNVYAFAGNDPINGRDPTGNKCWWERREAQMMEVMAAVSLDVAADREERVVLVCDGGGGGEAWGRAVSSFWERYAGSFDQALANLYTTEAEMGGVIWQLNRDENFAGDSPPKQIDVMGKVGEGNAAGGFWSLRRGERTFRLTWTPLRDRLEAAQRHGVPVDHPEGVWLYEGAYFSPTTGWIRARGYIFVTGVYYFEAFPGTFVDGPPCQCIP